MYKSFFTLLTVFLIVGCTEGVIMYTGQGDKLATVACLNNQLISGMTSCLNKASKMCPGGYFWEGSTNHPIPWQITSPDIPKYGPNDQLPGFSPGIVKYSNNNYGGYTKNPRIVNLQGHYQYITIKCKG